MWEIGLILLVGAILIFALRPTIRPGVERAMRERGMDIQQPLYLRILSLVGIALGGVGGFFLSASTRRYAEPPPYALEIGLACFGLGIVLMAICHLLRRLS